MKRMAWMFFVLLMAVTATMAKDGLAEQFVSPPDSAKPSGYWWWFHGLMDKNGITRNLEEFKAKGMGGVMLVCTINGYGVSGMPPGPDFFSLEWRELYKHSLKEANRLGLELGVNACGGWSMGGPWITPENSGRWFLQSELTLTGPRKFSDTLPLPGTKDGYDSPPNGNVAGFINLPLEQADYRDTAVVAFQEPAGGAQLRDQRRKSLPAKSNRLDASCFLPAREAMDQTLIPWTALPDDHPIAPGKVIDLTSKLDSKGHLEWNVPTGTWTIVRTGHRMTGEKVNMALPGGNGLEVDYFSSAAVDQHWEHFCRVLLEDAGPLVGKTLKYFATDSVESGYPNWTNQMLEQFKRYRGYDPKPFLPVFRGRLVGSAEISDRFLHDYRKTIADCGADHNYGHFAELCHACGLGLCAEAAGPSWSGTMCVDGLKNLGRCDMPQGEFWIDGLFFANGQNMVCKQTSSAAHVYGHKTASTESFTATWGKHWGDSPSSLKPKADLAFCEGINRLVFHTMTGSRPQDGLPGYEYGAGTHFNNNVTWWNQAAGPWLSYVTRCQTMLQSGLFVADVLYYNGDWAPNRVEPKHVDPALGKGYDYDVCNAEVLLTRLSVKNGRLVLPDGMSYRLLVLPDTKRMPAEVIQKIDQLVNAGATVVGPRPESDPGLKGYPACDAIVRKTAGKLWGGINGQTIVENKVGQGRVIQGKRLREILLADGVRPDIEVSGKPDAFIDFIHRATTDADYYFLANRNDRMEKVEVTFRQTGRQPELWNPVNGEQRDLPQFTSQDGQTSVPLEFERFGSMFIVFRKPAANIKGSNFVRFKTIQKVEGPWTVGFDKDWLYPLDGMTGQEANGVFVFKTLDDWSKRPEPAIKYFSGTARYHAEFAVQKDVAVGKRCWLDLGGVQVTASVRLNGVNLGVVWCDPWRVDVTKALNGGINQLDVEVVNRWPNRVIGDQIKCGEYKAYQDPAAYQNLPAGQRRTYTNVDMSREFKPLDKGLLPSGLLGPVCIETEE